jgi:DNA-binding transcriptional MocR family regulator
MVTNGSQDAFTRAIEMLADPGDALLVEDPTYAGLIAFAVRNMWKGW